MGKVAYRFLPYDDEGEPRESSQYTFISDSAEELGVGSVVRVPVFGYHEWEVVEIRRGRGPLSTAKDTDGTLLNFGGTLICRGLG
jgi:hypothetical protein